MLTFRLPLGLIGRELEHKDDRFTLRSLAQHFGELIANDYVSEAKKSHADYKIIVTWYELDKQYRKQKTFYYSELPY